jgi:signal transduction histidine kinase
MEEERAMRTVMTAQAKPGPSWWELRPTVLALVILFGAMTATGTWFGTYIEDGVAQRAASASVLEIDSLIRPHLQSLAGSPVLPEEAQAALSDAIAASPAGHDFAAIKIWSPGHTVVYSRPREMVGQTHTTTDKLRQALNGLVVAEYVDLTGSAGAQERSFGGRLLNVVAPIRESGGQQIIAVVEYYARHDGLHAELRRVRLQTWLVVVSLTIAISALLFFTVIRPSRNALLGQRAGLIELSSQNNDLRDRLRFSYRRMTATNEALMRRLSAELHDVPAQLIGFALLRLDAIRPRQRGWTSPRNGEEELLVAEEPRVFHTIRNALADSLNEIRNISAGLAAPELNGLSLAAALEVAVMRHIERTGTVVSRDLSDLPDVESPEVKLCAYRFVQEGLNNAFKHADSRGQALRVRCDGPLLEIMLSDQGPGFIDPGRSFISSDKLGLAGLRARIGSLGGCFEVQSQPGRGTQLIARFNLSEEELGNA